MEFKKIIKRHQVHMKLYKAGTLTFYKEKVHSYGEYYPINPKERTIKFERF